MTASNGRLHDPGQFNRITSRTDSPKGPIFFRGNLLEGHAACYRRGATSASYVRISVPLPSSPLSGATVMPFLPRGRRTRDARRAGFVVRQRQQPL